MNIKFIALLFTILTTNAFAGTDDYDFDFTVSGDRSVRPIQVFTNGVKTFFQFKDPQNPPTLFSKGRVVRFSIEEPYTVVTSLDSDTTIVGKNQREKAEVKYNGRFDVTKIPAPTKSITKLQISNEPNKVNPIAESKPFVETTNLKKTSDSAEVKTNSIANANLPPIKVEVTAPTNNAQTTLNPVAEIKPQPVALVKPVILQNQVFAGEFVFHPAKILSADSTVIPSEDSVKPVLPKTFPNQGEVKNPKSFLILSSTPINDDQIETLVAHVAAGGFIVLQGKSAVADPTSRVRWANARANKSKEELIALGIPSSAIKVQVINKYPNTDDVTGVAVTLTKGSST